MAPVQAEGQDEGALPADALRGEEDEGGVRQEGEGGGAAGGQCQKTFFLRLEISLSLSTTRGQCCKTCLSVIYGFS